MGGWEALTGLVLKDYVPVDELGLSHYNRALTEFRVMIYYISLLLFPHPSRLNLDYDFPISQSWVVPWTTLPSMILVLGSVGYAIIIAKRYSLVSFCILWFYGNLALESFILRLDLVFEHRLYLPSMGFFLLGSMGIVYWMQQRSYSPHRIQNRVYYTVLCSAVFFLCLWTYERNRVWQTEITLWEDVVKKSPEKARDYLNLGKAYQKAGQLDKANETYQAGLAHKPQKHYRSLLLVNQGVIQLQKRHYDTAMDLLEQAVQINPRYFFGWFNLGAAYKGINRDDLALQAYEKSRDLFPENEWSHLFIGEIYEKRGELKQALETYEQGTAVLGDHSWRLRNELARAYEYANRFQDAQKQYEISLTINPRQPEIHYRLGNIYYGQKRFNEALSEFTETLRLDPGHLEARNNLGSTYAVIGDLEKAAHEFSRVLDAKPDHPAASQNFQRARQILQSTRSK
jgi:tetratricopeptide (TPR) repeat protein